LPWGDLAAGEHCRIHSGERPVQLSSQSFHLLPGPFIVAVGKSGPRVIPTWRRDQMDLEARCPKWDLPATKLIPF